MNNQELICRLRETGQALEALAERLSGLGPDEYSDADSVEQAEDNARDRSEKPKAAANPFARIMEGVMAKPGVNPFQLLAGMSNLGGISGMSSLSGLGGLNALSSLGSQSLPTTLAELHDNPQLLAMLRGVSNNPQMLNMLSGLTGQDSQTLLRALQSLQPGAKPAEKAVSGAITDETPLKAANEASAEAVGEAAQPANGNLATIAAEAAAKNLAEAFSRPNAEAAAANPEPIATPAQSMAAAADIRRTAANAPAGSTYLDSLLAEWRWQPYARVWTV